MKLIKAFIVQTFHVKILKYNSSDIKTFCEIVEIDKSHLTKNEEGNFGYYKISFTKQMNATSRRDLFKKIRLWINEYKDPNIKKVRHKFLEAAGLRKASTNLVSGDKDELEWD